jgi:hypothetical protein
MTVAGIALGAIAVLAVEPSGCSGVQSCGLSAGRKGRLVLVSCHASAAILADD